ncbi:polysaccharide biosynthesis protein [Cellvibrio sp.]|uniref:polysaccharide biosynthesis protein n=1 Tax=Cellvibrio sp. TaxID=1965322 RepID=UPI0039647461
MLNKLFESSRTTKRIVSLSYDVIAIGLASYLAMCLRLGTLTPPFQIEEISVVLLTTAGSILVFIRMGMYRAILRYMSTTAMISIAISICVSGLIFTLMSFFTHSAIPRSVPFIYTLLAFLLIGTPRLLVRSIVLMLNNQFENTQENVIIYGAGHTGHQLALALQSGIHKVAGFVDDNVLIHGTIVAGIRVHPPKSIDFLIKKNNVSKILLALGNTSHSQRAKIIKELEKHAISVQTVPAVADILNGKTRIEQIRDIDIEDLLGRDSVKANPLLLHACISNKVVMVTGAGGSIGSELCRQIIHQSPKTLILFELNEFSLYSIEKELKQNIASLGATDIQIVSLLGSVQREDRMETIMSTFGVQTVYHAAAYKHVPLVEHNIVEGVVNNVFGTWYCAEAAIKAGVESFVLVSTDKAVRPTNIMGASKRMAELVLQALAKRQNKTRFTMVRFGNVLGSSGSVVPLFREQIKRGGPVTVTHPDIIRYFMTIPEAAELVIQAGSMGTGGDVFVLDMGEPVKIVDLAKRMIHLSGFEVKDDTHPLGDIEIQYTGLRPGEKLYEELLIGDNVTGTEHSRIMRAEEEHLSWSETALLLAKLDDACHSYKCDAVKKLLLEAPTGFNSKEQIRDEVWLKKQDYGKLRLV